MDLEALANEMKDLYNMMLPDPDRESIKKFRQIISLIRQIGLFMDNDKKITLPVLVAGVVSNICDNYCKYTDNDYILTHHIARDETGLPLACGECPLDVLQ